MVVKWWQNRRASLHRWCLFPAEEGVAERDDASGVSG